MDNKKGQFFGIYLVFITLFLCGTVIGFYYIQNDNTDSSLVSPRAVLEVEDGLEVFESAEVDLIKSSLEITSGEFGSDAFIESFRENFFDGVGPDMEEFIFQKLTLNGRLVERDARIQSPDFFKNILYPESESFFEKGKFIFRRASVGKEFLLVADGTTKINFPIEFSFEFERKYLISYGDDKFVVEVG